jgi:hypothetical protein
VRSRPLGSRSTRGFALIALLALLTAGVLYFMIGQFDATAARQHKEAITAKALAEAKAAIIAWSVLNATAPGRLLCPEDTTRIGSPMEGQALASCSNVAPSVGRLAWRTLQTGPLSDGDGEVLWYALSPGFRLSPINSTTVGQLSLDGAANAALAVVIAPGQPIAAQTRPAISAVAPPLAANYLDPPNNDGDLSFATTGPSITFNDRLITITRQELSKALARRIAADIRGYPGKGLKGYFDLVGFLPCAATVSGGAQVPATVNGFLPYLDLSFDAATDNLLTNNQWINVVTYSAPNCGTIAATNATITIGTAAIPLAFP